MKLSTKDRYATRLMLDLALHSSEGNVKLGDIAKRQQISEKYLWQVAAPLKMAGLISATPGGNGGYSLVRSPETITVGDIIRAVEGDCSLVDCVGSPDSCERSADCVVRGVWKNITDQLMKAMDSISLKDMMDQIGRASCRERG